MKKGLYFLLTLTFISLTCGFKDPGRFDEFKRALEDTTYDINTSGDMTVGGNVGIGTTDTSSAELTVNGDIVATGTVSINGTSGTNYFGSNVGIGSVSPAGALDVVGTTELDTVNISSTGTVNDLVLSGTGNILNKFEVEQFETIKPIQGNLYSATSSTAKAHTIRFVDSSFGDDEFFYIPTSQIALTPSFLSRGTLGVNGFEGNFTNLHTDVELPLGGATSNLDSDTGTPTSPVGDYSLRSTSSPRSGLSSWHIYGDTANEGSSIVVTPTIGKWYRSSVWYKVASGIIQVNCPSFIGWSSTGYGKSSGITASSWTNYTTDYIQPNTAGTTTITVKTSSAAAEFYQDDTSFEEVSPITGHGWVTAGTERTEFWITNSTETINACETAFDEGSAITNVIATADGTIYHEGTYSARFNVEDAFTTGTIGREIINTPFTTIDAVGFWLYSNIAISEGGLRVRFDNTALSASYESEIRCPAISAGTWTYVKLMPITPIGTTKPAPAISMSVVIASDLTGIAGYTDIYIDEVKGFRYGQVELTDNSILVSNSSTDGYFCVYDAEGTITPKMENKLGLAIPVTMELTYQKYED